MVAGRDGLGGIVDAGARADGARRWRTRLAGARGQIQCSISTGGARLGAIGSAAQA